MQGALSWLLLWLCMGECPLDAERAEPSPTSPPSFFQLPFLLLKTMHGRSCKLLSSSGVSFLLFSSWLFLTLVFTLSLIAELFFFKLFSFLRTAKLSLAPTIRLLLSSVFPSPSSIKQRPTFSLAKLHSSRLQATSPSRRKKKPRQPTLFFFSKRKLPPS